MRIRNRHEVLVDDQRDLVARLQFGFIPTRKRATRISRFELRSRDGMRLARGVLVLAAIEAMQLVVEDTAKADMECPVAGLERAIEAQDGTLPFGIEFGLAAE